MAKKKDINRPFRSGAGCIGYDGRTVTVLAPIPGANTIGVEFDCDSAAQAVVTVELLRERLTKGRSPAACDFRNVNSQENARRFLLDALAP
jgi:hypothetical protein